MISSLLFFLVAVLSLVSAFVPAQVPFAIVRCSQHLSPVLRFVNAGGQFPQEEGDEYTGDVDWDAEWKKVVASDGKLKDGAQRPGKDFYKSEAEIAAIKAANKATEKALEAGSSIRDSMPDVGSLTSDWKVRYNCENRRSKKRSYSVETNPPSFAVEYASSGLVF